MSVLKAERTDFVRKGGEKKSMQIDLPQETYEALEIEAKADYRTSKQMAEVIIIRHFDEIKKKTSMELAEAVKSFSEEEKVQRFRFP